MSRKVRDSSLETRTARSRLKVAHKPYYRLIAPGLHVGYRKLASGPGTWVVRRYVGDEKYTVKNLMTAENRLIIADDFADANGEDVLSFAQAQDAARGPAAVSAGPLTVKAAVEFYLKSKEGDGRDIVDSTSRANAHIIPALGNIECENLTTEKIKGWHRDLAKAAPRKRTKLGADQRFRETSDDEDSNRRRQASANRVLTILKAALNDSFNNGKIATDAAWRKVKPFEGVDASRLRYLQIEEAKRLINGADLDFRRLVQGALISGARYGQLALLIVSDFNPDAGTLRLRSRKGNGKEKVFHATLEHEGVEFFKEQCAGKAGYARIFQNNGRVQRAVAASDARIARRKAKGLPFADIATEFTDDRVWRESEQTRPMEDACKRANIIPPMGFHGLRHTWASHAVMNGTPLLVVAKNLGHSDTRMVEKHYGHLEPGYVQEAIRAGAPKFGYVPSKTVVAIARGAKS